MKGHHDIGGNEIADKLAKYGRQDGELINFVQCSDIQAAAKRIYRSAHESHWRSTAQYSNTQLLQVMPKMPVKPIFECLLMPRYLYTTLARILVGHGTFKSHMFKMRIAENAFCDCCPNEPIICDLNHIILNCHKYQTDREIFLQRFFEGSDCYFPTSVILILQRALSDIRCLRIFLKFIQEARLHLVV